MKDKETITLKEHEERLEMFATEIEGGNEWYTNNMLEQVSLKMLDSIADLREYQSKIIKSIDDPNKTKEEVHIATAEACGLEKAIDNNLDLFVQLRVNINPDLQESLFK